jgi:hypothetical protein
MFLVYTVALVLLYIVTSIAFFAFSERKASIFDCLAMGCLVNFAVWITVPLHYQWLEKKYVFRPSSRQKAIVFDEEQDRVAFVAKPDEAFWKWRVPSNLTIIPFCELITAAEGRVKPISANPKVRELLYNIVFSTGEIVENIVRAWSSAGKPRTDYSLILQKEVRKHFDNWLKFQLYEFNETHSQELSTLYNPMDENQQNRFRKMIEDFLVPRMPENWRKFLTLSLAEFSL